MKSAFLGVLCFFVSSFSQALSWDAFLIQASPTRGFLESIQDTTVEKIVFGAETGLYGVGIGFRDKLIPEAVKKRYPGYEVVEIFLGTLPAKVTTQVPQFATFLLYTKKLQNQKTEFVISENKTNSTARFIFSPPQTPKTQSDADALKNTFIGKSGTVSLSALEDPSLVAVEVGKEKALFKKAYMSFQLSTKLGTPFSTKERVLQGTIEIPVFWAKDQKGESFLKNHLEDAFQKMK